MPKVVEDFVAVEKYSKGPELVAKNKMGEVEPVVVAGLVGKSSGKLVVPELVAEEGLVLLW